MSSVPAAKISVRYLDTTIMIIFQLLYYHSPPLGPQKSIMFCQNISLFYRKYLLKPVICKLCGLYTPSLISHTEYKSHLSLVCVLFVITNLPVPSRFGDFYFNTPNLTQPLVGFVQHRDNTDEEQCLVMSTLMLSPRQISPMATSPSPMWNFN